MVELAVDWSGASMDDDVMGFTVGYSSGDAFDHAEAPDYAPTGRADYLTFLWSGHVQGPPSPSVHGCSAYEPPGEYRSEEHTSELQSLMRISYAVFCLKKK